VHRLAPGWRALGRPGGAALAAGLLALAWYLWGPPAGDAAAHLYQTQVWEQHGWRLWDNLWYSGRYSQVNYSLLFYPLAAALGTATVVAVSAAGAALAFALVVRRQWPAHAQVPVAAFAVLVTLGAAAGTYPFLLGLALALGSVAALQRRRLGLTVGLALLAALAHPLALAFLLAVLAGMAATTRGWWRDRGLVLMAAGLVGVLAVQVLLLRAFRASGAQYPFDPKDAVAIAGFCVAGAVLTRGMPGQRPLRVAFAAYGCMAAAAFALSSPVGGNVERLLLLMGTPLLLLPLAARRFRPRGLAAAIIAGALAWQALPAVAGWRTASETRAADEAYWYPVEAFLARNHDPNFRVQVVATADNWEAYYLARRGYALARGWFRQDDWPDNAALYGPLTPARYQAWLRRVAVRYVLLPDDPLDYSARTEAARLRAGSGLDVVARLGGWTVYELPDPTPIATPADGIRVLRLSADSVTLRATRAGTYRLRLRYTPYWKVTRGQACVAPRRPSGTKVRVSAPGVVTIRFDVRLATMVGAVLGDEGGCRRALVPVAGPPSPPAPPARLPMAQTAGN
jgi:hypothetical protein